MAFVTGLEAGRLQQDLNRFGQCSRSQSRQAARICFGLEVLEYHSVMVVLAPAMVFAQQIRLESYLQSEFELKAGQLQQIPNCVVQHSRLRLRQAQEKWIGE